MNYIVCPQSNIQSKEIGDQTQICQFVIIIPNEQIGKYCNICFDVFNENDIIIGDRVTVQSGAQLWDGLRILDDVFIGPDTTFANDLFPFSKQYPPTFLVTTVKVGASIEGGATILPGLTIGRGTMSGAGAVVT